MRTDWAQDLLQKRPPRISIFDDSPECILDLRISSYDHPGGQEGKQRGGIEPPPKAPINAVRNSPVEAPPFLRRGLAILPQDAFEPEHGQRGNLSTNRSTPGPSVRSGGVLQGLFTR